MTHVTERSEHIDRFYTLLATLESQVSGKRYLKECNGSMQWPLRGVYFFFESGEMRREPGASLRVVRVGTHAVKAGSRTTLWNRLSQHRGNASDLGGNHRGSIFRLLVGEALLMRGEFPEIAARATWGRGNTAPPAVRLLERPLEAAVSRHIGAMPFIWLPVDDAAGPTSLRGMVERNAIALLSHASTHAPIDSASPGWLGRNSGRARVRSSGLWNQHHVDEGYDPTFIEILAALVAGAGLRP